MMHTTIYWHEQSKLVKWYFHQFITSQKQKTERCISMDKNSNRNVDKNSNEMCGGLVMH
jgi:phosphorylcholine metabolism protein LicD